MSFELVKFSVLKVCKLSISQLFGLAEHYFLSEDSDLKNSVGWGSQGLELRGNVRITQQELERIDRFMAAARYNIALNNCEHFANYVLYGLNFSSQQQVWWKSLGAEVVSFLQPTQTVGENCSAHLRQQVADVLNKNLRLAKIERANRDRIEFWKARE